jgi:hypothetical protein
MIATVIGVAVDKCRTRPRIVALALGLLGLVLGGGAARAQSSGAEAIARWDVVPFQSFTGDFPVGVVAFHKAGIDRVEFTINGGPATVARSMTLNPVTGVWEYEAILRAGLLHAGPVLVRATAYPVRGTPRVLEPLALNADPTGHSLPTAIAYVSPWGNDLTGIGTAARPYRTIAKAARAAQNATHTGLADNCVVYLMPGNYTWGPAGLDQRGVSVGYAITHNAFLHVMAAPGVPPDQVRITAYAPGGLKTARLHVKGVTVYRTQLGNAPPPAGSGANPVIWFDECVLTATNRAVDTRWANSGDWTGGIYLTDCTVDSAKYGCVGGMMVRNTTMRHIGADALNNCQMAINVTVDDIAVPAGSSAHPDVIQFQGSATAWDNVIMYGIRATHCASQGFFVGYQGHVPGPAWSNFAFVNLMLDSRLTSQWNVSAHHVLFWHMTLPNSYAYIRDNPPPAGAGVTPTTITDFDMRDCVWRRFYMFATGPQPNFRDQTWAANNHFIDTTSGHVVGAGATRGGSLTQLFFNPVANDYRAKRASGLDRRANGVMVPVDAANRVLGAGASIGALQPPPTNGW